jgi:hypothetical protein
MIDVPRKESLGSDDELGWVRHPEYDAVVFCCPAGHRFMLFNPQQEAPRHGIRPDGTVDGSVVCPGRGSETCGFHETVRLLKWSGRDIARLF